MEKEPGPRIIIDNRERNGELIKAIESKGIGIEFRTAHVGDYIISDRVCIERKTVADFESCLISGRLFDQIKRLKENYEFPILVLEGDVDYFRLRNNVINGAIAALYIDYGVMMLHTSDAESTGLVIASMAKHEYENDIRAHTQDQFQEFIVGNIPGVGPKLARSLLAHFKSVRNIANADKSELVKVDKIGKKKADAIHSTLNALYKG
jgi:ERCC4-type nuclease